MSFYFRHNITFLKWSAKVLIIIPFQQVYLQKNNTININLHNTEHLMANSSIEKIISVDYKGFFLIAGPCAVESKEVCMEVAQECQRITESYGIPYIFKSSFIKANRTKRDSFRTIGVENAISILETLKEELNVCVTTDVHEVKDIELVKPFVDLIQIPAFLCRQTSLIESAALSGIPMNIKKGQFMSSEAMRHAVDKAKESGASEVFLTERGNSFGYNHLVVDMPNIDQMSMFCDGVIMDCTHATQRPNKTSGITGGNPADTKLLAKAALSVGATGLFIETHPDPKRALSDGSNMIPLADMEQLVSSLHRFTIAINSVE